MDELMTTPDAPNPTDGPTAPGTDRLIPAAAAIRGAVDLLSALTGLPRGSVTGARPTPQGGWSVLVDVVELDRIPASTSVLATYRVDVDSAGEFLSCERLRRYTRGATDS